MRAEKSGITDVTGKVRVARLDDAIVVTMPGTNYSVIYRRVQSSPWLLASDLRDDPNSPISRHTFGGSSIGLLQTRRRESSGGLFGRS